MTIYALVSLLLLTDWGWGLTVGLQIAGWWKTGAAACLLLAVSAAYRRRHTGISIMTENAALWLALGASGCVLTYLCATFKMPLQDARLEAIDLALGFDWLAWRDLVLASPLLHWLLSASYASLMPQIVFSLLFLPSVGLSARCYELVLLSTSTLIVTAWVSALWPALGPFATYGGEDTIYLSHVLALRAGGPWHFDLATMQGIIVAPSYHTVLALLFSFAHRKTGWVGWSVAGLNGIMLLSLPPIGGHYLVDMIAGSALTVIAIVAFQRFASTPARRTTAVAAYRAGETSIAAE
jgi:hypothetical protein